MTGRLKVWAINLENIGTKQDVVQKVVRPVTPQNRISTGGNHPTFTVEQLENKPAVFLVIHEETSNEWIVAEAADKVFEIVRGQTTNLPRVRGLTTRAIIAVAAKALDEADERKFERDNW